jgi:biotin-dependent carboxylase-like uncharacterized protein
MIEVVRAGPLATVQDLGRPGYAHLGVGCSGAADTFSLRLANRLVGNDEGAACIEFTYGGGAVRFLAGAWVALTGALVPGVSLNAPFYVSAGSVVRFGNPVSGIRTYLAVRGGLEVPSVLGSRSTDLLSGLGPAPLAAGDRLSVGSVGLSPILVDSAPVPVFEAVPVLGVLLGPREDWFTASAVEVLLRSTYEVTSESNRIGVRLSGPSLARARGGELPSEGMVTGALQVPPDGAPIIFLADHPTTGGYPVIAVLVASDIPKAAQLRPGAQVRFRRR